MAHMRTELVAATYIDGARIMVETMWLETEERYGSELLPASFLPKSGCATSATFRASYHSGCSRRSLDRHEATIDKIGTL